MVRRLPNRGDNVTKIVICFAETPDSHEEVVNRIVKLREQGDTSLPSDYLESFKSSRAQQNDLGKLFANLNDVANTLGN